MGVAITWLAPFEFALADEDRIDNRLINNFVEFYKCMLGFVNYKLYNSLDLEYPPRVNQKAAALGDELALEIKKVAKGSTKSATPIESKDTEKGAKVVAALTKAQKSHNTQPLSDHEKKRISTLESKLSKLPGDAEVVETEASGEVEEQPEVPQEIDPEKNDDVSTDELKKLKPTLFKGLVFFINREVPLTHLSFMIKSFCGSVTYSGGKYEERDSRITHQIVDRIIPSNKRISSREYVQPQWVFDSINSGILLPVHEYAPEVTLPPHLSPFVDDDEEGYMPDQRKHLDSLINRNSTDIDEGDNETQQEGDVEDEVQEDEDPTIREKEFDLDLQKELTGKRYSEVLEEEEQSKASKRKAEEMEAEEQKRLYAKAGLSYSEAISKKQKKTAKSIEAAGNREVLFNALSNRKKKLITAIERKQQQKKREVDVLVAKKQGREKAAVEKIRRDEAKSNGSNQKKGAQAHKKTNKTKNK
jgi:pescadillo protein